MTVEGSKSEPKLNLEFDISSFALALLLEISTIKSQNRVMLNMIEKLYSDEFDISLDEIKKNNTKKLDELHLKYVEGFLMILSKKGHEDESIRELLEYVRDNIE